MTKSTVHSTNYVVLLLALLVVATSCGKPGTPNPQTLTPEANAPRTYYDTLDLDTPESAVQTFVDAYRRADFFTVYMILSSQTQFQLQQDLALLQDHLYKIESKEKELEILLDAPYRFDSFEHFDSAYRFDVLMFSAMQHSALYFDLDGEVVIQEVKASVHPEYGPVTEVITNVGGIDGPVVFRMRQSVSGRWRVLQVILPGGDEDLLPWAIPIDE
jgi:hypothetical protein